MSEATTEPTTAKPTTAKRQGHSIRGALTGLVFGGFLAMFLLTIGVIPLDSLLLLLLPVLFLLVGVALGATTPIKRGRGSS